MPVFNKPDVNKPFAVNGTKVAPSETKIAQGWVEEIPPMEWQNYLQNRNDQFLAHVNQRGIPMWDSVTEYQAQTSYVMASNGVIYRAKQTNTNVNPLLDTTNTYWEIPFEQRGAAAAVQTALNTHVTNYGTLAGLANISTARSNLGLGSAATRNVGTGSGNVMEVGAFGVGGIQVINDPDITSLGLMVFKGTGAKFPSSIPRYTVLHIGYDTNTSTQIAEQVGNADTLTFVRNRTDGVWHPWIKIVKDNDFTDFAKTLFSASNASQARSTLGLGNAATYNAGSSAGTVLLSQTFIDQALKRSNNLNDLTNVGTARNNLGLGSAATKNVVNVPGNLDFSWSTSANGYQRLPSGLILQWGSTTLPNPGSSSSNLTVTFPIAFPNTAYYAGGSALAQSNSTFGQWPSVNVQNLGTTSFRLVVDSTVSSIPINQDIPLRWFAIGR